MKTIRILALVAAPVLLVLVGCATSTPGNGNSASAESKPDGQKLWAQNCVRCHNSRSPGEMSPAQWDVVMLHMRVRAGLTAPDHQAIREFLQSSN
jgi:mono/diheme cytochrome c family protein